ncbi:MAG: hypothetical protein FJ143_17700, partial [Deltaproteobacteria bacterium]|nr:hypothetical protein [Deltaproteobacteria bacterium]
MSLRHTICLTLGGLTALIAALGCGELRHTEVGRLQLQWIDVHVHLFADKGMSADFDKTARTALEIMDAEQIRKMVVMSPPRPRQGPDVESFAEIIKRYEPRFAMLGGGGT